MQEVAGSTPAFSTILPQLLDYQEAIFYIGAYGAFFASVDLKSCLKLPKNFSKIYPFKSAKLVDCKGNIKQRWYVHFYVYHKQEGGLVRKRLYDVNKFKTSDERYAFAKRQIEHIDTLLEEGHIIDETAQKKSETVFDYEDLNVISALNNILERNKIELRPKSYSDYRGAVRDLTSYLKKYGLHQISIDELDSNVSQEFLNYLLSRKGLNPVTVNNKRQRLTALFSDLKRMKMIRENPFSETKTYKTEVSNRNRAFTDGELKKILGQVKKKDPQFFLFIQLIYYCFLRPNEIRLLKAKNIHLSRNRIEISAHVSKNRKTQGVEIPEPLYQDLSTFIKRLPKENYLFSHSGPGESPVGINYYSNKFRELRTKLKLDLDCTLYSFKHTGVVKLYRKIKDIKAIQIQCRHSSIEMTDIYLKSLGLYENKEVREKFPKLG